MPGKNEVLHGCARDKSPVTLIQIDVVNHSEFPEGKQLPRFAMTRGDRNESLVRQDATHQPPGDFARQGKLPDAEDFENRRR